jgi:hypothetical protein
MKKESVGKSVSGLKWAAKICSAAGRKPVDTIRETMLLSASFLLVLLEVIKTTPPVSDVKIKQP